MAKPKDPTLRKCSRCKAWKVPEDFHSNRWYCKTCSRIYESLRYQEDERHREAKKAHARQRYAIPAVRERKLAQDRLRRSTEAYRAAKRDRYADPLVKARIQRSNSKSKLKHAATTERRRSLLALIRAYDAEIARIEAIRKAEVA